jgi:rhamnosyltransferase
MHTDTAVACVDMNLESSPSKATGVVAIIVSYNPEPARLRMLVKAIVPQVDHTVVVDNASPGDVAAILVAMDEPRLNFLPLRNNLGIAAAHNAGICWAREQGAEFVLLMDQDSVPDAGMVASLSAAYQQLVAAGNKVAAVGPRFRDIESGRLAPHVRFGAIRFIPISCTPDQQVVVTDLLISSGSLISIKALDAIGEMDEVLFIDQVDTEWVLRARAKGYTVWGHCQAAMTHALGETRRRVWLGRWREIPLHKPFRYYYMFRNSLLLQRRGYPCWAWRRVDMIRLMQIMVLMTIFHPQRLSALRSMIKGAWHAIRRNGLG